MVWTSRDVSSERGAMAQHDLPSVDAMRAALRDERFELHFQPIIDLRTMKLAAMEALLRWRTPDGDLRRASDFLAVLDHSGMIVEVGAWALRSACRTAQHAASVLGRPIRAAVNISRRELAAPNLVDTVAAALAESDAPRSTLQIEVTEATLAAEPDLASARLDALIALGVRVGLDDVGGGASLPMLQRFSLHLLKLDRVLVSQLDSQPRAQQATRSLISLAHRLDLSVVAEGVETASELAWLRDEGADYAQGYHISRPQPREALMDRWASGG